MDIDDMVTHYLTAALWLSTDDGDRPLDHDYGLSDFTEDATSQALNDCTKFVEQAGELLNGITPESAGHDFWLTRNHHGAGFWDRGYPKAQGDGLTLLAYKFGDINAVTTGTGSVTFI